VSDRAKVATRDRRKVLILPVDRKQHSNESNTVRIAWAVKSTGGLLKIPTPRTGNWAKSFGGWKGFVEEIHRSTGRNLGGGVLQLSVPNLSEKSDLILSSQEDIIELITIAFDVFMSNV